MGKPLWSNHPAFINKPPEIREFVDSMPPGGDYTIKTTGQPCVITSYETNGGVTVTVKPLDGSSSVNGLTIHDLQKK